VGDVVLLQKRLNEKERAPGDAPSIGIILCAAKDNLEVEFALKSKTNPIGVAEHQLRSARPAALPTALPTAPQGKLPTAKPLEVAMRDALPRGPKRLKGQ